jgi:hypothetical protein
MPCLYPIPHCDFAVGFSFGKAKFRWLLDAPQGFHQIAINKASQEKLAFAAPYTRKYMAQLLMSQVPDPSLDCSPPLVSSSATYSNQRIIQDLVTTVLLSTTSKLPPSSAALSGMSNAQQIDCSEWKLSATSASEV